MEILKLTVSEIITILSVTEKYAIIDSDEFTNKESIDFLYAMENQNELFYVVDKKSYLLLW